MKRKILAVLLAAMCLTLLAGCGKKGTPVNTENLMTTVVEAETGETFTVSLDTSNGYTLITDPPFAVYRDGYEMATGTFTVSDAYDTYLNALKTENEDLLRQEGKKDGHPFFSYTVESPVGDEHNYFVQFPHTTLVIASIGYEESDIQAVFDALSFSVE